MIAVQSYFYQSITQPQPAYKGKISFPFSHLGLKNGTLKNTQKDINENSSFIESVSFTVPEERARNISSRKIILENIKEHLEDSENYSIVLRDKSDKTKATGFIDYFYTPTQIIGSISNVYVDSKFQKKGIGEWITRSLINKAKEKGCQEIWLGVVNPKAENLYRKLGFKELGIDKDCIKIMSLNL